MPRPPKPRAVRHDPQVVYFKPAGVQLRLLQEVALGLDELEAMRLADLENLSHEEVGALMNVSRATAGRILAEARRKVAEALVQGLAIRLEGGTVETVTEDDTKERDDMPGEDRTGPRGQGPRTGRGLGRCGTDEDQNKPVTDERPLGQGRGLGLGRRGGPGRGRGPGLGRGPGKGPGRGRGR